MNLRSIGLGCSPPSSKLYTTQSRHCHSFLTTNKRYASHIATSSATGATSSLPEDAKPVNDATSSSSPTPTPSSSTTTESPSGIQAILGFFRAQQQKSAELRKKLVSLGPAAVLAYGMFDGISYTIAFAIAFLGYEARTGLNPTANVADIIKICILMWAGNNVTRPFRLAGAAALAPFMDEVMIKLQNKLNLPNKLFAFFMIVALVAFICLSIVGSLFLSRYVQG